MAKGSNASEARRIGAMLDARDVDRLRRATVWLQKTRGVRYKDIAAGCSFPEHTVRNFAHGKSKRPDNTFVGQLASYLATNRDLLPDALRPPAVWASSASRPAELSKPARFDAIRAEMPIEEADLRRVYERYAGYYLCFARSARLDRIAVSWLHIRPLPKTGAARLPLPRFTWYSRYTDRVDASVARSYVVAGYCVARHGCVFLTGQTDGEPRYLMLQEPAVPRFAFLDGLLLDRAPDTREPAAARVLCRYLGVRATNSDRRGIVGEYRLPQFRRAFPAAAAVEAALGADGVLVSRPSAIPGRSRRP
jgi:hypothetical protein